MALETTPVLLQKGDFLMLQGAKSDSFYVLKTGRLEALIVSGNDSPNQEKVEADGRQVSVIDKPNQPIGEVGAIEGTPRSASIRALEPCELIEVPGGSKAVISWIKGNLQAGLHIVKTLAQRTERSHGRWNSVRLLEERVKSFEKNFSIIYAIFRTRSGDTTASFKDIYDRGKNHVAKMDSQDPPPISNIDNDIPASDAPPPVAQPFEAVERAYFINKLLSQKKESLAWLLESGDRIHPLTFLAADTSRILFKMSNELQAEMKRLEEIIDRFFDSNGIIHAFSSLFTSLDEKSRKPLLPYISKLQSVSKFEVKAIYSLWGQTYPDAPMIADALDALEASINSAPAAPQEESETQESDDSTEEASKVEVAFSLKDAFEFVPLSEDEKLAVDICLGIKEVEDVTKVYNSFWQLYAKTWQTSIEKDVPELTAFLRYGICSPEEIHLPPAFTLSKSVQGPVMFGDQWIERIYLSKSPPSRNELGQSMQEVLKLKKQDRYRTDLNDPQMDLVHYEIEQMGSRATRAFSGGKGELVTIRRTETEINDLAENMATPGKLAESLIQLIKLDFSAFYRDIRVVLEDRSDFLPADVIPFLIILPGGGERSLSWQEFEGRAKDTPGRICFPLVHETPMYQLIVESVARFRWNIAKETAGANWMSPVDGGLTGKYYDYITFYKKNTELSDEAKQKIKEVFAGISMDIDKFVIDYCNWIQFESNGIQKLNKVGRRIFADSVPFDITTRKKLVRQPAFSDILRKDSNKRLKKIQELERRIYSLERKGVGIGNTFDTALKLHEAIIEDD